MQDIIQFMHNNMPKNMQMMRDEIQDLGLDDNTVMKSSRALRRLNNYESRVFPRAGNEAESQKKHSEFSLDDLRKELREDIDAAIQENFEIFDRKFTMFSEQLERSKHEIISVIREGPYEKIKDPVRTTVLWYFVRKSELISVGNQVMRQIWKEMVSSLRCLLQPTRMP